MFVDDVRHVVELYGISCISVTLVKRLTGLVLPRPCLFQSKLFCVYY